MDATSMTGEETETGGVTHRRIRVNDVSLAVRTAGSGAWVLFVHGVLVHGGSFDEVLRDLGGNFRCVVPDLPGFGRSDKRDPRGFDYGREALASCLVGLMDQLGAQRFHVVGHSMGGGVAATLAADHADRVERLVLIDSVGLPYSPPLKAKLLKVSKLGEFLLHRAYTWPIFYHYFRDEVYGGAGRFSEEAVRDYYMWFDTPSARRAALACLRKTMDVASLVPKLSRISCPTFVLWGERDRIFKPGLGRKLQQRVPEGQWAMIAGSGHAPQEEFPQETARLVGDFLRASK